MSNVFVIEADKILETKYEDDYIVIKVKSVEHAQYFEPEKRDRINWSERWGDFSIAFLSQEFIEQHKFSTEEKIKMTHYIKDYFRKKAF